MQAFEPGPVNPSTASFNQSGQIIIEDVNAQEIGNSELIPKSEFSFRSRAQLTKPIRVLRSLSFASIFLSLYQFAYATTSLALHSTPYNVVSMLFGLFTVLLSFTLAIWSAKSLRTEQSSNLLNQGLQTTVWEGILRSLYIALMFRAAIALPAIANMVSISHHTPEHLRAYGATFEEPRYTTLGDILNNVAIPMPLIELFLCITFIQGARLSFRYITDPSYTMTRMIYLGSLSLMGSALSLIYNTRVSKDYHDANSLSELYPSSDLSTLGVLAVAMVPLAFVVWLLNIKKWRVPSAMLCLTLVVLSTSLFVTSLSGYNNTHNVYAAYRDTSSLNAWSQKMERTYQPDFEAFASVPKYLPLHMCDYPILDAVFDSHQTVDGKSITCINTSCAKLLGQFYAAPFAAMSNSGLMAAISCLIITVGFLYFWHIGWRDLGVRRKGNFKWFVMLLGMLVVSSIILISHEGSYFHQYGTDAAPAATVNGPTTEPISVSLNEMTQRPNPREESTVDRNTLPEEPLTVEFNVMDETNRVVRSNIHVNVRQLSKNSYGEILAEDNSNQKAPFTTTVTPAFTTTIKNLGDFTVDVNALSEPNASSRMLSYQDDDTNSPYSEVFEKLTNRKYKFVILSHDPEDPQNVNVLVGPWNMNFDHFAANFDGKSEEVGFIQIGEYGRETLYQVIFSPKKTKPAQVLAGFFLPTNTKILEEIGLHNVHTYIARKYKDLSLHRLIYESRAPGIISLAALSQTVKAERVSDYSDSDSPYAEVLSDLAQKNYKWVVFQRDHHDPLSIDISAASWDFTFEDFVSAFTNNDEQVGFIYLGDEGEEQLHIVAFAPASNAKLAQVLYDFYLPSNTHDLKDHGLANAHTFIARSYKDLSLQNIQKSPIDNNIACLFSQDATSVLVSQDESPYANAFNALLSKKYRFILLSHNKENYQKINLDAAPWDWLFSDLANAIDEYREQVGFIQLGQPGKEKLYMIVYNPKYLNKNAGLVLDGFGLPRDVSQLQRQGLSGLNYFVAQTRNELTTENTIMKSKSSGTVNLFEIEPTILVFEDSPYAGAFNALASKRYRFILLSHNKQNYNQITLDAGPWDWLFSDLANALDEYREQVGFIYLGQPGREKPYMIVWNPKYLNKNAGLVLDGFGLPREVSQLQRQGFSGLNYFVAQTRGELTTENVILKSKATGTVSLFEEPSPLVLVAEQYANSPFTNVFNALASKKFRFIILKHDPTNFSNIKIDAGPWDWIFSDFVDYFNAYREQVGFVYLGQPNKENLYMVVSNPKYLNKNGAQILQGFGLPAYANELQAQGLPQLPYIYVAKDLSEITLDNVIMQSKKGGSAYV